MTHEDFYNVVKRLIPDKNNFRDAQSFMYESARFSEYLLKLLDKKEGTPGWRLKKKEMSDKTKDIVDKIDD